jgi:hypothetical protein
LYFFIPNKKNSLNESFVNKNWITSFANFIHSGPLTFTHVILVLHHKLGQSLGFLHVYPLVFLDFLSCLDFFVGSKMGNNKGFVDRHSDIGTRRFKYASFDLSLI